MGIGLSQFRKYAGAAGAALLALTPAGVARADDVAQGARVERVEAVVDQARELMIQERREAEMAADAYSEAHPGIGIVVLGSTINSDTGERVGPDGIGAWIQENFRNKGVDSTYYTGWEDQDGFAVLFLVRGLGYGYYGADELNDGFKLVVEHQKEAWPNVYAAVDPTLIQDRN